MALKNGGGTHAEVKQCQSLEKYVMTITDIEMSSLGSIEDDNRHKYMEQLTHIHVQLKSMAEKYQDLVKVDQVSPFTSNISDRYTKNHRHVYSRNIQAHNVRRNVRQDVRQRNCRG